MDDGSEKPGSSEKRESLGILGDTLKKVFAVGVTAAFMTEESIRSYLQDLKLPKDILNLLLQQASKSKEDVANRIAKEVVGLLSKVDFEQEVSKFAQGHKFKVTAEFEITKKE